MNAPVPGWQPDPTGRHDYRYWDGTRWTDDVSDAGATSVDPIGGPPQPAQEPTAVQPSVPPGYGEPPPAYVDGYPGGPSHMSPSSGGSGPSTGLLIGLGLLVAALVGGILFVLLNQDDDDTTSDTTTTSTSTTQPTTTTTAGEVTSEQVVDEFAASILSGSNGEFTEDQAHCMAEGILDVIGLERLAQVRIEAGDGNQNPVDLLTEEEQEAAFDVMRECVPDATIDQIPT